MDATNDMSRTRKRKPRPMRSGTLDSLGGGNILRADSPDTKEYNVRSLELLLSYQDNIPQNMVLIAREGKQKPSSSGTLDPTGGGNLVRIVDSDMDTGVYRSLESLLENEADTYDNTFSLSREETPKHSASRTLDSIGGGHLLGIVDPDTETEVFRSLVSRLENQDYNLPRWVSLARDDNQKHSSSGTLDSIGGGHLLRIVDPDSDTEIFRSLVSRLENQDYNLPSWVSLARDDNQKHSSSGTLDSIGGGHLLRIVDPDSDTEIFRSPVSRLENQDYNLPSWVSLARDDNQKHSSSGTLDSIGGGHLLRLVDPDSDTEIFRSLVSRLENQDYNLPSWVSLARDDNQKHSSSGTLDSIGGGHLLRIVDPDSDTEIFSSLVSRLENQNHNFPSWASLAREDKQKYSSSGTLDSIGGGHLLRLVDPDADTEFFRSLVSRLENQDNILQNKVSLSREEKQKPSLSGTLNPFGGDNFDRVVDPGVDEFFISFQLFLHNQEDSTVSLAREDKQNHSSSGTLDPIGGGNLVRVVDPEVDEEFVRSLNLNNQDDSRVSLAREDKQKPSSSGTLDPIGGGNLVRVVDPVVADEFLRSLPLSNQDDSRVSLAREDKQKPSSSGTLDPIGGGNLVRVVDPVVADEFLRSLPLNNQDDSRVSLAREDKQKPSSSGTLDPIGGGNLVRVVDPVVADEFLRSLPLNNQDDSRVSLAREDKQKPSSSGTLDPIGGGNLVRVVDPVVADEFLRFLPLNNQDDSRVSLAREDKEKPSSSGTLDPIGGGNLVRIVDPEFKTEVVSSLESLIDNQDDVYRENKPTPKPEFLGTLDPIGGDSIVRADADVGVFRTTESFANSQGRQNMMRLAREDKSSQRSSSHALDGLGGGVAGPYRGQFLQSHLTNSLDQGDDVLRMLDSISGRDLLSSLDSAEGMAVLSALRKTHTKYPKRMLDSVSGWAFGESKRNFDEIDNVGFTGFAKRSPRYRQLALAKKNFDEIDRAGFETYNKRDFDEIDRAGFETFEKRDRKE